MLQEIRDLREEGEALYGLLSGLDEEQWREQTQFKQWTVHDVVLHLHFSDYMALTTARSKEDFQAVLIEVMTAMGQGVGLMQHSRDWMGEISGARLLQKWWAMFQEMCEQFGSLDPKTRLDWFGPDMGVRMFATARQMETWAHGQELYDLMGLERTNTDRIKNVVVLGLKTHGWTFVNRGQKPPGELPHLKLTSPSGALWEWGEDNHTDAITGSAVEFAQVVTQVRNIADTALEVEGEGAQAWMAIAQCFAGPPEDPPAPGTRFRKQS